MWAIFVFVNILGGDFIEFFQSGFVYMLGYNVIPIVMHLNFLKKLSFFFALLCLSLDLLVTKLVF